jgi:hypothetical protein
MKLLAENVLDARQIDLNSLDPAYRRATLNMALTTLNCEQLLKMLPATVSKDQISFVVGTHFGEVSTTLEFLRVYHETQTPRPILFQNSLHNSTLGFASIHLGLTGPAMTVSCDRDTEKAAMEISESLLQITPYVMLCYVDSIPDSLTEHYLETYPFLEKFLNKARCFLFARA